jgi:hypothetical protein
VDLCFHLPPCGFVLHGDGTDMSNSTASDFQNQGILLGPCIVGLFLQGLETGLVIAMSSQWFFSPERNDSVAFSALVIFVTVVGL